MRALSARLRCICHHRLCCTRRGTCRGQWTRRGAHREVGSTVGSSPGRNARYVARQISRFHRRSRVRQCSRLLRSVAPHGSGSWSRIDATTDRSRRQVSARYGWVIHESSEDGRETPDSNVGSGRHRAYITAGVPGSRRVTLRVGSEVGGRPAVARSDIVTTPQQECGEACQDSRLWLPIGGSPFCSSSSLVTSPTCASRSFCIG